MKILQVNKLYYPVIGGVEKVAQDIAEGLNGKDNLKITTLVCQKKGKRQKDIVNGAEIYRAASFGSLFRMPISIDFFRLYKKLANDCDLILLHHPFPLSFLAYIIFSPKKKLIIWYHSDIVKQKFLGFLLKPFLRRVLRSAKLILVSNNNLIKFSPELKLYRDKCRVIPFGINIEQFRMTEELRAESEKIIDQYQKPIILSVGRLVYYKGFEYLIRACKGLDDIMLLIIGDGPLKEHLQGLINEYNLGDRVKIIGHVPDLKPYYYASKIFVLPSVANSEAFGLVQIEALACGKPVINTNLPTGVPEVSLDKQTGITVEPKNSGQLAVAINEILQNNDIYDNFSANAISRARENFSMDNFLATNKEYFFKILKDK